MKDVHHLQRSTVCNIPTSDFSILLSFLLLPCIPVVMRSVNPSLNFLISLSPFSCYINSADRSVLFWQVKAFHRGHKNVLLVATLN